MHVHLDDLHPTVDPLANAQFRSAPPQDRYCIGLCSYKDGWRYTPVNRVLLIKLQNKRENAPSQRAEAMSTLHTTEMGEFGGNSGRQIASLSNPAFSGNRLLPYQPPLPPRAVSFLSIFMQPVLTDHSSRMTMCKVRFMRGIGSIFRCSRKIRSNWSNLEELVCMV